MYKKINSEEIIKEIREAEDNIINLIEKSNYKRILKNFTSLIIDIHNNEQVYGLRFLLEYKNNNLEHILEVKSAYFDKIKVTKNNTKKLLNI